MSRKKNEQKFTIQFRETDSHHIKAAEILNAQGRHKAQFIVEAVLHYTNCTSQPTDDASQTAVIDYGKIEDIVKRVVFAERIHEENFVQPVRLNNKKETDASTADGIQPDINSEDISMIAGSIDIFRKK